MNLEKRKKWAANEVSVVRKDVSRELYEEHLKELAECLYTVFANQIENQTAENKEIKEAA